jgi:solute carrier family 25 thiamine pyrophosphate transporter 19
MSRKNQVSTTQELISGGIAGGVARGLLGPLDLIKIRYQLQAHRISGGYRAGTANPLQPQYRSLIGTVRTVIAEEGFWVCVKLFLSSPYAF